MIRHTLFVVAIVCALGTTVQAVPVQRTHTFSSGPECANQGVASLAIVMDRYGSFGHASAAAGNGAVFNPADDMPDRGAQRTVYDSTPFLCTVGGGQVSGTWLSMGVVGGDVAADANGNQMTSQYQVGDLRVDFTAELDCSVLTQCYTFTNVSDRRIDTVALIQYVDGDLYFDGSFNNDYGGTGAGVSNRGWSAGLHEDLRWRRGVVHVGR